MIEIDPAALEAARLVVEDVLVELRDARIGIIGRGNGFVIREDDGKESSVMRLGTPEGLRIAIQAYLAKVAADQWVTFFPYGDHKPSGGYTVYGPFDSQESAKEHARTLSSDPDEGQVARLVRPS